MGGAWTGTWSPVNRGSLNKLEKHGYIFRKPDHDDKRKSIIHLTKAGLAGREVAKEIVLEFNNKVFSHFEKSEMDIFFNVLKKINQIINSDK